MPPHPPGPVLSRRSSWSLPSPIRHLFTGGVLLLAVAQSAPAQSPIPSFAVGIRDGEFVPTSLEVPAGQKLELRVTNERKTAAEFESSDLRREKVVPVGGQVTVYVGPLRPGTYEFFDDFNPQIRGRLVAR
jgi:hypothetical protein